MKTIEHRALHGWKPVHRITEMTEFSEITPEITEMTLKSQEWHLN